MNKLLAVLVVAMMSTPVAAAEYDAAEVKAYNNCLSASENFSGGPACIKPEPRLSECELLNQNFSGGPECFEPRNACGVFSIQDNTFTIKDVTVHDGEETLGDYDEVVLKLQPSGVLELHSVE